MTNGEKFTTADERVEHFYVSCRKAGVEVKGIYQFANWLDNESDQESILSCPFCGSTNTHICKDGDGSNCWFVECKLCLARGPEKVSADKAVEMFNRICREVAAFKESEVRDGE